MITERKSSQFEGCKRQSENRSNSVNASIAGGSPQPSKLAPPHCWLGENPGPPHSEKKGVMKLRTRDVTITIRCTEDERRKIRERAASRGLKLSDFVLRSALGKKIIVLDGFWELSKQLKAVGNNLNQLTRLCNEGRVKVAELKECRGLLMDIYGRLGEILREVK